MGYATTYELETDVPDNDFADEQIHLAINNYLATVKLQWGETINDCLEDSCKWYDHEADMKALSATFPAVLFTLHGDGEENGDLWFKYFCNGKMQVCKAICTYPPFDAAKLT